MVGWKCKVRQGMPLCIPAERQERDPMLGIRLLTWAGRIPHLVFDAPEPMYGLASSQASLLSSPQLPLLDKGLLPDRFLCRSKGRSATAMRIGRASHRSRL